MAIDTQKLTPEFAALVRAAEKLGALSVYIMFVAPDDEHNPDVSAILANISQWQREQILVLLSNAIAADILSTPHATEIIPRNDSLN